MRKTLVALDTDHIKEYVFATDKLKEIRGASSILDLLNRRVMDTVAEEKEFQAKKVYANGGSGLFLIDGDKTIAERFGRRLQQEYRNETQGGASITFAVEEIPESVNDVWKEKIWPTLELLRYGLVEKKSYPLGVITLSSHPFMRLCDACGMRYAEKRDPNEADDQANRENRYCNVCWTKRQEDIKVKAGIDRIIDERVDTGGVTPNRKNPFAWERVIKLLPPEYVIPRGTERPPDFNELRGISGGKDYLALIYADGNGMGQLMGDLEKLTEVNKTAEIIDEAVYEALSMAINKHLKVIPGDKNSPPMFPFDILLVGGDDVMIVTPAVFALDVALTIAKTFHERTKSLDPKGEGYALSTGVILAPVKYPFGLLQELAESTLKFAKKATAKNPPKTAYGDTIINFMTVTGSNSLNFNKVYELLHKKTKDDRDPAFYATLRPYSIEELTELLNMIRDGKRKGLGRTKLHQLREAVLRMNLTTSVSEGLAVLSNWHGKQREFVVEQVYKLAGRYQEQHRDVEKPGSLFQRVTFPWFADGLHTYRTSLLDFVELYDFVAQEEVEDAK